MSTDLPDYYLLLGVDRHATLDEINAAYHKLMLAYESITVKTPEAQERFGEIKIAYSVLTDPEKRAMYDQTLPPAPVSSGGAPLSTTPGQVPWKISDVAIGLALLVATQVGVGIFVGVGILVSMALHGGSMSGVTDALFFGAAQVGELLMFVVAWVFGVVRYRAKWSALGFRAPAGGASAFGWLALAVFGMFTVSAAYSIVVSGLGASSFEPGPPLPSSLLTSAWSKAALIVLAVLVAPFGEETFFRGFVFGGLNKRLGFWWGAIISAALFAAAHVSLAALAPIFFIGLLLAWLYKRTGAIWLCMIAHGIYNGVAIIAFLANMPF